MAAVDLQAADALVDRNYAAVYRYAFRLSGCASLAEDIVQEVFVKAISHLHQLRAAEAERGWLLAIARREFLRWLRSASKPANRGALRLDEEPAASELDECQPDHELLADNRDWVQASLMELGEDTQAVLLMYYFEELSYAEIAEQLNIPIGTVMSRLSRGRQHMRTNLERLATPKPTPLLQPANASPASTVLSSRDAIPPIPRELKHG